MVKDKSEKTKKIIEKREFKKKMGNKCVYCGCTNPLILTIDHIIPLIRGGLDISKNKQVCCFICNQLKGALTDEEFKKYMVALEILYDLTKFRLDITLDKKTSMVYKPHHYPDFQFNDKLDDIFKLESNKKKEKGCCHVDGYLCNVDNCLLKDNYLRDKENEKQR